MKLRLTRHNYKVNTTWVMGGIPVTACFGLSAAPLNAVKALKIARVLYPGQREMKVNVVNLAAVKAKPKVSAPPSRQLQPHEDATNKSGIGEG